AERLLPALGQIGGSNVPLRGDHHAVVLENEIRGILPVTALVERAHQPTTLGPAPSQRSRLRVEQQNAMVNLLLVARIDRSNQEAGGRLLHLYDGALQLGRIGPQARAARRGERGDRIPVGGVEAWTVRRREHRGETELELAWLLRVVVGLDLLRLRVVLNPRARRVVVP